MNTSRIRRVVYALESPLSERDVDRFGMRILQDAGFDVTVWDLSTLYLPSTGRRPSEQPDGLTVTVIETFEEFSGMCAAMDDQVAVICILGVYRGQLRSHHRLLAALSGTPAILATVSAGHLPIELVVGDDYLEIERLTSPRRRISTRVRTQAVSLRRAISSFGPVRGALDAATMRAHRLRPLDIVWVGTTTADINPPLLSPRTVVRYVHSLDFDRIPAHLLEDHGEGTGIVLIDSLGPLHPDYSMYYEASGLPRPENAVARYFTAIRKALDDIETTSGESVTIAAHPRATRGLLEEHYAGRTVVYLDTVDQVAKASVVLITGPTTALSLVTTMRKPAMIISSASFDPYLQVVLPRLSALLHLEVWDADTQHNTWRTPALDEVSYADYVSRYVKREGSLTLPFWKQVAHDLTAWGTPGFPDGLGFGAEDTVMGAEDGQD